MNAKILGTAVITYPYTWEDFVKDNNNSNYPPDTDMLVIFPETAAAEGGYECVAVIILPPPAYNPFTQICTQNEYPSLVDGAWVLEWTVRDMTPQELQVEQEKQRQANKAQAEQMLAASDWSEVPSVTNTSLNPHLINSNEFVDYRVALRSIAVNPPVIVAVWPVEPDEIWS